MKMLYLISCLAATCTLQATGEVSNTVVEQEAATLQQIVARMSHTLNSLEKVQNKTEADAVADEMLAIMALVAELEENGTISPEAIEESMSTVRQSKQNLEEIVVRLAKHRFYGSTKLAHLFGEEGDSTSEGTDLPEPLQKVWAERMQQAITDNKLPFTGGPGFTRDGAWKFTLTVGDVESYLPILEKALSTEFRLLELYMSMGSDEKGRYQMYQYAVRVGNEQYNVELWFDLTDSVGDIYYTEHEND